MRVSEEWYAEKLRQVAEKILTPRMPSLEKPVGPPNQIIRSSDTTKPSSRPSVSSPRIYTLVGLCQSAGIPEPIPEYRFHPTRRWRFDYAWPLQKIALEIDGAIWTNGRHSRGSGRIADMEKASEAAVLGWRLLLVTPEQVRDGAAIGLLLRALKPTGPEAA